MQSPQGIEVQVDAALIEKQAHILTCLLMKHEALDEFDQTSHAYAVIRSLINHAKSEDRMELCTIVLPRKNAHLHIQMIVQDVRTDGSCLRMEPSISQVTFEYITVPKTGVPYLRITELLQDSIGLPVTGYSPLRM